MNNGYTRHVGVCHKFVGAHRAHDVEKMLTLLADDMTIRSAAGRDKPPSLGETEGRRALADNVHYLSGFQDGR